MICEECVCCPRWNRPQLMDSLGLLYEKPSGFCVEGLSLALTFTLNCLFLWKITFSTFAPESFRSVCVCCGALAMAASLSHLCVHDLKDVFVYWLGLACFQVRFLLRTFLWRENEEPEIYFHLITTKYFFSRPKQPTSKLQKRHLSVIWGSGCTAVLPWSEDKKTRWYLWKTLWL